MINCVSVSMSEVAMSGTLSPLFHIASKRLAPRLEQLKSSLSEKEAIALSASLADMLNPSHRSMLLEPVRRGGSNFQLGWGDVAALSKAHPYMVLALLSEAIPVISASLDQKAAEIAAKQDGLAEIISKIPQAPSSPSPPAP